MISDGLLEAMNGIAKEVDAVNPRSFLSNVLGIGSKPSCLFLGFESLVESNLLRHLLKNCKRMKMVVAVILHHEVLTWLGMRSSAAPFLHGARRAASR
jgi:hypothetical protein